MDEKKRVLVVDDEQAVLRFVDIGLTNAGYDVLTASNGKDALDLVKNEKPDIMVLDVLMVPMTGFDVLTELRTFSKMPVIVFTAKSFIGDEAIKAGADGYLGKPFKPEDLIKKIETILNH